MKKTYLSAGVSILLWSTMAVTAKLLLEDLSSVQLLCASTLFAFLFLLIYNISTGVIKEIANYTARDYIITLLAGLPGTFLYYIFYYAGADLLPASQAFIINYTWPIMSVIFAGIVLKERITPRKFIAILISFAGVAVVAGGDPAGFNSNTISGAILCILGAVSYGMFTAFNQKVSYNKQNTLLISYFMTFVISLVINVVNGSTFVPDAGQLLGFVWVGIFTNAIANTVWVIALSKAGNTAKIANLAYITPFLSLLWTFFVLKENIGLNSLIGLVVIMAGIFIQIRDGKKL